MKKNVKVITINGFRGIVFACFLLFGLIMGFVVAPAYFCKEIWNFAATNFIPLPQMEILHGAMLWAIISLSIFALCKNRIYISMPIKPKTDREIIKEFAKANADIIKSMSDNKDTIMPEDEQMKEEIKK